MKFEKIDVTKANVNPFQRIGQDWMLISAKKEGKVNTMTASWGMMGVFWGKNVVTVGIRPQRFTKEFVDAGDRLSVSVLNDSHRELLSYFGSVSGRDEDKIAKSGLALSEEEGIPYFADSEIAFLCRKLYAQPMDASFLLEPEIDKLWYPNGNWHTMYIVEIEKLLMKEQ